MRDATRMRAELAESRVAVLGAALLKSARACVECHGTGERRELFIVHLLTTDPRLMLHHLTPEQWKRRMTHGPTVSKQPNGAGTLRTPCAGCRHIRQALECCEVSE